MSDMIFDVLILGGGPGGLTAGIYAGRAQLKTGMIERLMPGGQVAGTELIENYPGFADGVAGPDLMMAMEKQARKFGLEIMTGTIESLDFKCRMHVGRAAMCWPLIDNHCHLKSV